MNLYQSNFNQNEALRSKRLRHVHLIFAKNLLINANKFSIWFTLHQTPHSKAFYCSEKRQNERSPKWHSLNMSTKSACKNFILRIWYTNNDTVASENNKLGLNLLLEANILLDGLVVAAENNIDYLSSTNLLVFEIFGKNYCEPLTDIKPVQISRPPTTKNSYSVRTLMRLHDFQRVMHESSSKIDKLKQTSLLKFEASSRLRELQAKREKLKQKLSVYQDQLCYSNKSIKSLTEFNLRSKLRSEGFALKLDNKLKAFEHEKEQQFVLENSLILNLKVLEHEEEKLRRRQRHMIAELAEIFSVEHLKGLKQNNTRNRMSILNVNFRSYNNTNSVIKNVEHQNAVVLGYIIHSIVLISNILNIPLRHPCIFRGSKSIIIEQLNPDSISEFPLFKPSSSTQDLHFAHAVTLLNKNLSQIRIIYDSYKNVDTNDMLGNLKWIFDHL